MGNYKVKITNHLKELGVPANLSGYPYLRYAIELVVKDTTYLNAITKRLYPDIAKHFSTTPEGANRSIKHAVEIGWYRGNKEIQYKLFGYSVDMNKGCPTNSEFIATIADYICVYESEGA